MMKEAIRANSRAEMRASAPLCMRASMLTVFSECSGVSKLRDGRRRRDSSRSETRKTKGRKRDGKLKHGRLGYHNEKKAKTKDLRIFRYRKEWCSI
jgi:hypothetical protein